MVNQANIMDYIKKTHKLTYRFSRNGAIYQRRITPISDDTSFKCV